MCGHSPMTPHRTDLKFALDMGARRYLAGPIARGPDQSIACFSRRGRKSVRSPVPDLSGNPPSMPAFREREREKKRKEQGKQRKKNRAKREGACARVPTRAQSRPSAGFSFNFLNNFLCEISAELASKAFSTDL